MSATATAPPVERTFGDWTEYHTEGGDLYYYNNVTQETSWECPAEFVTAAGGEDPNVRIPCVCVFECC